MIRIGILGAARVAPHGLIQPARGASGVTVAAVASRTPSKARAFATTHRIPRAHGSYQALVGDPAVDAVYVALPPALHEEWACRALEAGKHVLCEKPLAANASQAEAMVSCARRHGRVLQEGLHFFYMGALRQQRRLVASGELGRLLRIESCMRFATVPFAPGDFRLDFELGGGAGLDLGCYAVACLRYVAGEEPEVTSARHRCETPQVDNWMQSSMRLPSGAEGIAECGFKGAHTPRFGVSVTCERGSIEWDQSGLVCTRDGRTSRTPVPPAWTYRLQLEAFARRIRGESADAPPADDAIATARVVDAMYDRAGLARRGTAVHA